MEPSLEANLAARATRGDDAAFTALCAANLDAVYDFCLVVCGDARAAATLTAEAMERAATALASLETGMDVRAWFLRLARARLLRAEDAGASGAAADVPVAVEPAGPGEDTPAPPLLTAFRALGMRHHALLDLELRKGLRGPALALAMGVSSASAPVLAGRALEAARTRLGDVILDAGCAQIAALGHGPDDSEREARERHVHGCRQCQAVLEGAGDLLAAYAAIAPVAAPAVVRAEVLGRLRRGWQRRQSGPPKYSGTGKPMHARPRATALLAFAPLTLAAIVLGCILAVPSSPLALTRDRGPRFAPPLSAAATAGAPTATPTAGPAIVAPMPTPTPSPAPATATPPPPAPTATTATPTPSPTSISTPTPAATPTVTPRPTATATATPEAPTPAPTPPGPTPTRTPPACVPALDANTKLVRTLPRQTSSFVLFNTSDCAADYTIDAPAVSWLQITSARAGMVAPLRSVTVTFVADPLTPARTEIVVHGPSGAFSVTVESQ